MFAKQIIPIFPPTLGGLLKAVRHNGGPTDDHREVGGVLLPHQVLGNGLAHGVGVGAAHQLGVAHGGRPVAVAGENLVDQRLRRLRQRVDLLLDVQQVAVGVGGRDVDD